MKVQKILTRIYVNQLDDQVAFYENIFGLKAEKRIRNEAQGLEFVELGSFLFVGGSDEDLRFVRRTFATVMVDSLEEFKPFLKQQGVKILRDIQPDGTGRNMIVRHPDGLAMEYVEYCRNT